MLLAFLIFKYYQLEVGILAYIEIKLNKNCYPSQLQKDWISDLLDRGYYAEVCKGYDQCIETLENYFINERTNETKENY